MKPNFVLFKVFAKTFDISTSNFYWIIERSKPQSNVLLIFCDYSYFIFKKFETVSFAQSVMVRLWHSLKREVGMRRQPYAFTGQPCY